MKLKDLLDSKKLPIRVLAYNDASASAKELVRAFKDLGYDVAIRRRDAVQKESLVIRWGNNEAVSVTGRDVRVINHRPALRLAVNKTQTLECLQKAQVPTPEHTKDPDEAAAWLKDGEAVVCRHFLTAHSGRGIQVVRETGEVYKHASVQGPWYTAKLFTKYFKRAHEYRVFVAGGTPILAYRKGAARDIADTERQWYVRTHETGWNFCSIELSDVPAAVVQASVAAVQALGLNFGAVDVGWNEHKEAACVFEVNAAPGMTSSTADVVARGLLEIDESTLVTGPVVNVHVTNFIPRELVWSTPVR